NARGVTVELRRGVDQAPLLGWPVPVAGYSGSAPDGAHSEARVGLRPCVALRGTQERQLTSPEGTRRRGARPTGWLRPASHELLAEKDRERRTDRCNNTPVYAR